HWVGNRGCTSERSRQKGVCHMSKAGCDANRVVELRPMKQTLGKVLDFKSRHLVLLLLLTSALDHSVSAAQRQTLNSSQSADNRQLQTKLELDVRDYGVDCTFRRDSSGALNTITADSSTNGRAITFPPGCHVRLANTWLIKNLSGFTIRGTSGAGNNGYYRTNVPTITWSGSRGGTMIDMEYVDGFVVENMAFEGDGIAAVGINIDRHVGGGTVNTTDGLFRRIQMT